MNNICICIIFAFLKKGKNTLRKVNIPTNTIKCNNCNNCYNLAAELCFFCATGHPLCYQPTHIRRIRPKLSEVNYKLSYSLIFSININTNLSFFGHICFISEVVCLFNNFEIFRAYRDTILCRCAAVSLRSNKHPHVNNFF